MPTLITPDVVRVAEDVEDRIYNFNPSDSPIVSMIERKKVSSNFHEWTRDNYRTPDGTRGAIEGANASETALDQPAPLNNRTQIFEDGFAISNTTEAVKKYGRSNEAAYQKSKVMVELKRDIEAAIVGSGASVTGTSGTAPKLRGMYGFFTKRRTGAGVGAAPNPVTNTAPVAGTLAVFSETILKTGIQSCFENGGDASIVSCSPAHKVAISSFTAGVTRNVDVGKEAATVNAAFDFYRSDFGVTKIIPNRVQAVTGAGLANTVYIFDADKLALGQLRGFESEEMAKTGDARKWQVRTEVTFIVKDEKPCYAIADCTLAGI